MQELLVPLGVVGGVLLLASLTAGLVERGPISFPIVFLGAGILVGPGVLDQVTLDLHAPVLEGVAFVTLALVLFLDAVRLDLPDERRDWVVPALTLGPGTLTIIALVAVASSLLVGLDPALALVAGAALASTDPVVLRDVVRDVRLPGSVRRALSIEAGTNDLIVLPIVLVAAAAATASGRGVAGWAGFLLQLFVVGPALGAAIGAGGAWLVARVDARTPIRQEYQAMFGLGLVLAAFAAGETLGADGFLASFAAGAAVALTNNRLCDCFLEFGEIIAEMLMLISFVLFGVVLSGVLAGAVTPATVLLAAVVLLVARPVVLGGLLSIRHAGLSRAARGFIAWFGPRGLNSLLLALIAVGAGVPDGEALFTTVGVVVTISVVLHGASATPLANAYAAVLAGRVTDEEREPSATGVFRSADLADQPRVDVATLSSWLAEVRPVRVADVRARSAFQAGRVLPGAEHVPPDAVDEWAQGLDDGEVVVTYCTCPREATAARVVRHLRSLGWEAHALVGGLDAWEADGHPTSVLDTTFRGPPTVDTPQ